MSKVIDELKNSEYAKEIIGKETCGTDEYLVNQALTYESIGELERLMIIAIMADHPNVTSKSVIELGKLARKHLPDTDLAEYSGLDFPVLMCNLTMMLIALHNVLPIDNDAASIIHHFLIELGKRNQAHDAITMWNDMKEIHIK